MIAQIMHMFELKLHDQQKYQFLQTYSLEKGIKKLGDYGQIAAIKEMEQLKKRQVFQPIQESDLSDIEKYRALKSFFS
jgi:hypothetical protein